MKRKCLLSPSMTLRSKASMKRKLHSLERSPLDLCQDPLSSEEDPVEVLAPAPEVEGAIPSKRRIRRVVSSSLVAS